MTKKVSIGDVVRVVFLDHCTGKGPDAGLITFECFGRVLGIGKKHYDICNWGYLPEAAEPVDTNCEFMHILKGAVVSIERLK